MELAYFIITALVLLQLVSVCVMVVQSRIIRAVNLGRLTWRRDKIHTFGENPSHGWVRVVDTDGQVRNLRFTADAYRRMLQGAEANPEDAP